MLCAQCVLPPNRFQQQIDGDREFSRKMEEFAVQQRLEVQKKREVR